jgi:hypothetical protein
MKNDAGTSKNHTTSQNDYLCMDRILQIGPLVEPGRLTRSHPTVPRVARSTNSAHVDCWPYARICIGVWGAKRVAAPQSGPARDVPSAITQHSKTQGSTAAQRPFHMRSSPEVYKTTRFRARHRGHQPPALLHGTSPPVAPPAPPLMGIGGNRGCSR